MMRKLFLMLILFIGINRVYAINYEADTQAMIDSIDSNYMVGVASGVEINLGSKYYYMSYMIRDSILNNFPGYVYEDIFVDIHMIDESHFQISIENKRMCELVHGLKNCDESITKSKEITFICYPVTGGLTLDTILNELNRKPQLTNFSNALSNFDGINFPSFNEIEIVTTSGELNRLANEYNLKYIKYTGYSGQAKSNDNLLKVNRSAFNYMFVQNNTIVGIDPDMIYDVNTDNAYYYPMLSASDYMTVDAYIEDAMEAFPVKLLMPSYEIILQDGEKYIYENGTYKVNVKSGYDDAIWHIEFGGTFKEYTEIKGDMNENGRIDLQDIIILLRLYLGI